MDFANTIVPATFVRRRTTRQNKAPRVGRSALLPSSRTSRKTLAKIPEAKAVARMILTDVGAEFDEVLT